MSLVSKERSEQIRHDDRAFTLLCKAAKHYILAHGVDSRERFQKAARDAFSEAQMDLVEEKGGAE